MLIRTKLLLDYFKHNNQIRYPFPSLFECVHSAAATSVTWVSHDEIITVADDHEAQLWNLSKNQHTKLMSLPESLFPVAIDCPPKSGATPLGKRGPIGTFALSSTDGLFKEL